MLNIVELGCKERYRTMIPLTATCDSAPGLPRKPALRDKLPPLIPVTLPAH